MSKNDYRPFGQLDTDWLFEDLGTIGELIERQMLITFIRESTVEAQYSKGKGSPDLPISQRQLDRLEEAGFLHVRHLGYSLKTKNKNDFTRHPVIGVSATTNGHEFIQCSAQFKEL